MAAGKEEKARVGRERNGEGAIALPRRLYSLGFNMLQRQQRTRCATAEITLDLTYKRHATDGGVPPLVDVYPITPITGAHLGERTGARRSISAADFTNRSPPVSLALFQVTRWQRYSAARRRQRRGICRGCWYSS